VTVTYQQFGGSHAQEQFLTGVKAEFEKANPGVTLDLQPITASENDYYTKLQLQLQMRSANTSPDVVYEDTFLINSDIEAGYLRS
jgi:multiple sugar transport system substrate-binding protein